MTRELRQPHDRSMQLSSTLSWLVDAAGETPGADRLLAEVGARLVADGLPLAGGALTLAVPHPLIARRTWLWRAESGEVIEALGFVAGGLAAVGAASPPGDAGRRWLAGLAAGLVHQDAIGSRPDGPSLGWIGPRPFTPGEANELRQAARFAAAPLAAITARATLTAALDAYLGRRSAARVLAGPLRRDIGETIQAALLYADLRGFTALSESNPPAAVISALDAWFDRIAGRSTPSAVKRYPAAACRFAASFSAFGSFHFRWRSFMASSFDRSGRLLSETDSPASDRIRSRISCACSRAGRLHAAARYPHRQRSAPSRRQRRGPSLRAQIASLPRRPRNPG